MHQLEMMDEEFCLVPVCGERSPEAGSLLADCFIGYDGNSAAKGITRHPSTDLELLPGQVFRFGGDEKNTSSNVSKWSFSFTAMPNDAPGVSYSSDGGSEAGVSDDDPSWLEEFMSVYGVNDLGKNDDFCMKSCSETLMVMPESKKDVATVLQMQWDEQENTEVSLKKSVSLQLPSVDDASIKNEGVRTDEATIPGAKERTKKLKVDNNQLCGITASKSRKSETLMVETCSSFRKGSHGIVCDKRSICSPSEQGRKCTTTATPTGSARISERKREQNRFAAVRYRDKRREEAKQKKEELHGLELRNVQLKTELTWLEKEVAYLKNLMKLTKGL